MSDRLALSIVLALAMWFIQAAGVQAYALADGTTDMTNLANVGITLFFSLLIFAFGYLVIFRED